MSQVLAVAWHYYLVVVPLVLLALITGYRIISKHLSELNELDRREAESIKLMRQWERERLRDRRNGWRG